MHAGFPRFPQGLEKILGLNQKYLERLAGRALAQVMATALEWGFAILFRDSLLNNRQVERANRMFKDAFVFVDPDAPDGVRFYQGKFLIRTKTRGDDMNVWFHFCPNPDKLFRKRYWLFGKKILNPDAIIESGVLNEEEADRMEQNPNAVDLIIRFKDSASIVSLVSRGNADMVGLLLDNVVQLTGNTGHLFKLGAVATNLESAVTETLAIAR
ncbi:MAG: hypothetical protein HQL53_01365 [Magnetococcales bacterium]|nr:hypothetical protein [Magnetococcales bacterium]